MAVVNCKDDALPGSISVDFLETLMADTGFLLQMSMIWLWYKVASSLFCVGW